jgi:hypothetical protein
LPPLPEVHALFGVTTSALSRPGFAATSSCWTRRAPRISPTVPASTLSPPWSVQAGYSVGESPGSGPAEDERAKQDRRAAGDSMVLSA